MAKGTLIFFVFLTIIATLLFGINLGKKLGVSQLSTRVPQPTTNNLQPTTPPTLAPSPIASPSATVKKTSGTTTFSDRTCGFSFSFPGSFVKQKTVNAQSTIYTDPDNPGVAIAATCAAKIPRPPVSSDKIESIVLDKAPATLYHDQGSDGSPRDEVIAKHPTNGQEIILAGYGEVFQQALASFKFTQ